MIACYLIVQNGDPRKEVIALGQTYFAIQTYRQEEEKLRFVLLCRHINIQGPIFSSNNTRWD